MVHNANERMVSLNAYNGGGCRVNIPKVDDKTLMQEANDFHGMRGEQWPKCEAPQNYGFTSVVHEADKDADGNMTYGAEGFVSFMGSNRSFPICTVMDDRRHRLKGLEAGDTAFNRGKDDRQQFHMTKDGNFLSCRNDRVNRMALVDPPKKKQQQAQGNQPAGQGGNGGGGEEDDGKPKGQTAALDDNKKSKVFFEQQGEKTVCAHGDAFARQQGNSDSSNYYGDLKKSTQATSLHCHLRLNDMRIFVDEMGCWSEVPILVKPDPYCKA